MCAWGLSGAAGCGCGTLFLLRGSPPACKKQTAAPAPLRLSRPLDAPQLRSPARVGGSPLRHSPLARPVPPPPHAWEVNVTYRFRPPTFTGLRS